MASTVGHNKVFIIDKYFSELNKFWQSEFHAQEKQQKNAQESNNNNNNNNNHNTLNLQFSQSFLFNYPLRNILNNGFQNPLQDIDDLIHLDGPITEDSLIRALHSRFLDNQRFVSDLSP